MTDLNAAKNQIDLDALERAITGPDVSTFTLQNGPLRALISELRAARDVVGGAQTMRSLYPRIWEEYSKNGLDSALADFESNRSYVPCVDVIFDGPPGPESGRFVECEDVEGRGVRAGEWIERGDGMWALRIPLGQRVTTTGPSSECGFCAAEHPSPNQPGACVMFWQGLADGYRDALHRISGLALTGDFTAAAKGDLAIDYAKTALMGK